MVVTEGVGFLNKGEGHYCNVTKRGGIGQNIKKNHV